MSVPPALVGWPGITGCNVKMKKKNLDDIGAFFFFTAPRGDEHDLFFIPQLF